MANQVGHRIRTHFHDVELVVDPGTRPEDVEQQFHRASRSADRGDDFGA